ncbi:inositol monophosphatase family protein [uncultured Devosia sp.]|uniref:inositol monophosphatase family protein n=1 Tax=uncultured Devosia sp. TaxID=211434 RepID=UPI0035C9E062
MSIDSVGLAQRLLAAEAIALEAGQLAARLLADRAALGVSLKGAQDFVSTADVAVEQLIVGRLAAAFPADGMLGEEGTDIKGISGAIWAIDPIDGTSNFVAGRPDWCVSIGLVVAGWAQLGAIYQPSQQALYSARRGHGARRNGVPLRVAERPLAQSTVVLEYSSRVRPERHAAHVLSLLGTGAEYRRNGSAAVALAQVAEGTLDGFFEAHLNAWDVTAGLVLVAEAGGRCNDFFADDGLRKGNRVIAAAPALFERLAELFHTGAI